MTANDVQKNIDRFTTLSPRGKKAIIEEYGIYHDLVFPNIDVDSYNVLYAEHSRGSSHIRVYVMLYFLMVKENCSHLELESA